jgi:hypothetical protein
MKTVIPLVMMQSASESVSWMVPATMLPGRGASRAAAPGERTLS